MFEQEQQQADTTDAVSETPETPQQGADPVESGTTDQETDEQRNEREVRERRERSERQLSRIQSRFNELTRDKHAERSARERAEREADELRRQIDALKGAVKPVAGDGGAAQRPQRGDFDSYEEFVRADARWEAKEVVRQEREQERREREAERQRGEQVRTKQEVAEAIQRSAAKVREQVKDFDDVISELDFEAPPAMERAIAKCDNPAAILYVLGKQPNQARLIANMDPIDQVRAIAQIEHALRSASSQVSKAPPPGKPAGSKGAGSNEPPEDPEAYFRWAEKNLK